MAEVTLEHLLTHTSGFPYAPLGPPRGTPVSRGCEVFSRWYATAEPGTSFTYHPTAAHWVVAEMIEVDRGARLPPGGRRAHHRTARAAVVQRGRTARGPGRHRRAVDRRRARDLRGDGRGARRLRPALLDEVSPTILMAFNEPVGPRRRRARRWRHRHRRRPGDVLPGAAARPGRASGTPRSWPTRPVTSAARCRTR